MTMTGARPGLLTDEKKANSADTYGWDNAFAITFTDANKAITANWAKVNDGAKKLVAKVSDDPSYHIDAVLGPWQITLGGDGRNIRMACPVVSGTYNAGSHAIPLDGINMGVEIEIGMEWVPDPSQFAFVIDDAAKVAAIKAALNNGVVAPQLQTEFTNHQKPLPAGAQVTDIKSGVEWVIVGNPNDNTSTFYIFHSGDKFANEFLNVYQFEEAWKSNLEALSKAASSDEPAVAIITITRNPAKGMAAAALESLLSDWFNANIGEFNHVFASLDLSPIVSKTDKFAWMKPTATSYAVTDQGTMETSVLGALTMALNHPPGTNHQVSPYAIPAGSNAGFLISGPMFMQQMLLTGAQLIFNNAPADAFMISADGLTIRNKADMVWGTFMLENKKVGAITPQGFPAAFDAGIVPPQLPQQFGFIPPPPPFPPTQWTVVRAVSKGTQWLIKGGSTEYILNLTSDATPMLEMYESTVVNIAKEQFTMSFMNSYIEIEFTDLDYSYSPDFDVHVNYKEQMTLSLQVKDGKNIFWFDQVFKKLVTEVTKTQKAITREIVEGAVAGVLALLAIAGPILEGLMSAVEIADLTEDGATAVVEADEFTALANKFPKETLEDAEETGLTASEWLSGKMTNIKGAFGTPKWKVAGAFAATGAAIAGVDASVEAIIASVARSEWKEVPAFDAFAELAIKPYVWPSIPTYTLNSATVNGSFQLGLTVKQS